jgi:UDP-N-acetylglucosamine--N-acetylmuramyl-(pentapeptide) pyrophosphoryl-undecaprenol N-acetylglucosamine transferase
MALVNKGAALIVEEKDLTKEKMQSLFETLAKDDSNRKNIEANAKAMAVADAKEKIADIVLSLIK